VAFVYADAMMDDGETHYPGLQESERDGTNTLSEQQLKNSHTQGQGQVPCTNRSLNHPVSQHELHAMLSVLPHPDTQLTNHSCIARYIVTPTPVRYPVHAQNP
jgi:hypothetical protein